MENASKALLIAGAILIAIVLISVGMAVLNSTTDVTDQVGDITTTQAAQTFNKNFEAYAGEQKGSSVKSLLGSIATSNGTNTEHTITVKTVGFGSDACKGANGSNVAGDITSCMKDVKNSEKYTVSISGMTAGYISEITISD